jgi:predicted O-methyltransferase YrrM
VNDASPDRWQYTLAYLTEVFGVEDPAAAGIRQQSLQAGLPPIAVSSDIGHLLTLLVRLTGVRTALEIGTLGGYSALHIVRGLAPGGRLITIERDPTAFEVARHALIDAGVADRVRCELGAAADVLPRIAGELGPDSVEFIFLDAKKAEYADYWARARPLLRPGGLLVADNILGTANWWIDHVDHPVRRSVDVFSRTIASDPTLEAAGILAHRGLLLARRRDDNPENG